jgi:hypothetical protein
VGVSDSVLGMPEVFDEGILVEVEVNEFAIVFAEDEAIEPELVVLGVGVPGAGFGLLVADDGPFDDGGEAGVGGGPGHLLGDTDARAGVVSIGGHGQEYKGVGARRGPGQGG